MKKLAIVLVICIIGFMGLTNFYKSNQRSKGEVNYDTVKKDTESENELALEEDITVGAEVDDRFTITSEENTSAAVDELIRKGKQYALNATEQDFKEAIQFIDVNYNNYWVDNETMHKGLYYGAMLEYLKHDKDSEELGMDTVQVIKYIYRNAEKVEDESTQSNLQQIQRSLNKISDDYKK